MRYAALALVVAFGLAAPALAQAPAASLSSAPPSPASTPVPAPAADLTKTGKPRAKEVRKTCRDEAKAQGLKGDARRKAVSDCFIKQRPDLAAQENAREQCFTDAKAKGMKKDARKDFMKECRKAKG